MTIGILLALLAIFVIMGGIGAVITDTVSVPISGKSGNASILVDSGADQIEYKCIMDGFSIVENTEMTVADTFCTEGTADQEPGRSQLQFDMSGVLKYNGPASGPFIPAPQNVGIKFTYFTGCFIDADWNITQSRADRIVNQVARLAARGYSKGTYSVTWDKA